MQQNAKVYAGMAAVQQQVLNWLYSVLTSVRNSDVFYLVITDSRTRNIKM
jgi:hypothetical protein